jgi:Skp family chaperone for outer membrane proteins
MKSLSALFVLCAASLSHAAGFGVVDEAEVFKKYAKSIDLQAEVRKSQETAQAAVSEREKALVALRDELQGIAKRSQDPMLSENGKKTVNAELEAKNATFQQRRGELQNFINEAQGTIQQRAGEMNKQVIADIRTQSEKVAKAKGLQLVIGKGAAFYSDAALDVTEDVLKELNAAYKPAAPAAAATDKPAAPTADKSAAPAPATDKPAAK